MTNLETTVAVCGHAQHGKSTLTGRLMVELGGVSEHDFQRRWEQISREIEHLPRNKRRDFNPYNSLLLEARTETFVKTEAKIEQKTGQTVRTESPVRTAYPTRASVNVGGKRLTLIDEPGHLKYLGNMIYGIHLADCGLIVVDVAATVDIGRDEKMVPIGTKIAFDLLKFFDVKILAFCLTKMDRVGYSEDAYGAMRQGLIEELNLGSTEPPPMIPLHALTQAKSIADEPNLSWYQGPRLVEVLEDYPKMQRDLAKPMRCSVKQVFSPPGAGTVLVGVLESGEIKADDHLVLEPVSTTSGKRVAIRCRSVQEARAINEKRSANLEVIYARSIVSIATADLQRQDAEPLLKHGGVLGLASSPPRVAKSIRARIVFFQPDTFYRGKKYKLHSGLSDTEAEIGVIHFSTPGVAVGEELVDMRTSKPRIKFGGTPSGETVEATLVFERPICIEADPVFERLTSFVLREKREVVACGNCLEILSES
jgi:elongation factor 1-alpha